MKRVILVLAMMAVFLGVGSTISMAADSVQTIFVMVASGAGLDSDNGAVHIQIAPNSFNDNFKLRFSPNSGSAFAVRPPDSILLPNAFNLEFLEGNDKFTSLHALGTAVVKYNPSDLGGRSEATLRLMWLPEDGDTWQGVSSTVDVATHTVTARFTESGDYAVAASNAVPAPAPAPAPTAAPVPAQAPPPAPAPAPVPAPAPAPVQAAPPTFKLGFATLASLIPNLVGQPLENEHYGPNGDSLQQTTTGLMVWRKADNWTAFTNGSRTWINGPLGLQERPNEERFDWEK